jgi:hypothetical protein
MAVSFFRPGFYQRSSAHPRHPISWHGRPTLSTLEGWEAPARPALGASPAHRRAPLCFAAEKTPSRCRGRRQPGPGRARAHERWHHRACHQPNLMLRRVGHVPSTPSPQGAEVRANPQGPRQLFCSPTLSRPVLSVFAPGESGPPCPPWARSGRSTTRHWAGPDERPAVLGHAPAETLAEAAPRAARARQLHRRRRVGRWAASARRAGRKTPQVGRGRLCWGVHQSATSAGACSRADGGPARGGGSTAGEGRR